MEPLSIDSVVVDSPLMAPTRPDTPPSGAIPIEPSKLKGRHRLLQGLQRMSSQPSLARMRATSNPTYRTGGKASMSCVSLASVSSPYATPYGSSYSSEISAGYSTAPTSVTSSPGPGSPLFDERARIRTIRPNTPTTAALPSDLRPMTRDGIDIEGDYFSRPITHGKKLERRKNFNFWSDMPTEIRMEILRYLTPKEIVRCSVISKSWHTTCFDGQLWGRLDVSEYYTDIPAEALTRIITTAGPFVRDLNLRGCIQLKDRWVPTGLADACTNLENFSLEGCRIDRTSIHSFLLQNRRLLHVNLSGLAGATNSAMKILAQHCPRVEHLNITWCNNVDTRGIRKVIEGCPNLRDLRAGEVRGWDDVEFMAEVFKRNTLERLVLMHCDSLNDDSLAALVVGIDPEIDLLTNRPVVPPRRLKHLDLTHCRGVSDVGIKVLAHNVPHLEGLQLAKCHSLTDDSLIELLPTLPVLTHLDIEEIDSLSNAALQKLAVSPFTPHLRHLTISYCENLGDSGMLPVLKACPQLASLKMDNTRVSDLVLTEAAACVRERNRAARPLKHGERPTVALHIDAYDCANVTWTGVREVMSRNSEAHRALGGAGVVYPSSIIALKCFYNWQPTVKAHTVRVLRGDFASATRLERKWAEYMMLNEEAGAGGAGGRRRRRRAREAREMFNDEEGTDSGAGAGGIGRRRRARSGPGGCIVM